MNKTFIFAGVFTLVFFGARVSRAQEVINLATGLDSNGNLQTAGNLLDANWSIIGGSNTESGASAGQAFTVASNNADWYSGWQTNGPNSSWIAQDPLTNVNGLLDATRTFNLSQSQLATAVFSGMGASLDDAGEVLLNGNVVLSGLIYQNAGALTTFNLSNADLVAGVNTLEIKVTSTDYNLEGVRLEGNLTVQSQAVPEPGGFVMGLLGLSLFALKYRRQ